MRKIVQSFRNILTFIGLGACASLVVATVVALRHMLNTPQPLESMLPGDAHIYRWRREHIFYKTLGDENAPPCILLHAPALGASAYEMRKIIGALAQRYHIYALDLLGFGLSDHPQIDYSADTYVSMCHDFLAEVVAQPATILASGLSCNYAVIVAKRFPATCTRLVLISPTELSGNEQKPWSKLLEQPLARFLLYPLLTTRAALLYTMNRQHSPHLGQVPASTVDYLYATTHQFGAEYAAMALLAGKLSVDASQEFDALQQPTLVIWGARGLNNTPSIKKQQTMPTQTEIALIQDAGIFVHEEYPALVVANILEWSEEFQAALATTVAARSTTKKAAASAAVAEAKTEAEKLEIEEPGDKEESDSKALSPESETAQVQSAQNSTGETLIAYCVKCKKKTPMRDAQEVTMKNGSPAVKGKCSICGTGQYRIGRIEKENL